MARYIDAEELCRRLEECWHTNDAEKGKNIQAVIDRVITPIVVGTPAADVVEVVRCKDCKHYSDFDPMNCKRLSFHFCKKFSNITIENDFCSYGERKEK